ncbi:MAG TPA: 1-deoxy-D-xylulose-5-phosphate reductoisomerase [Chloroflexota bacterium]
MDNALRLAVLGSTGSVGRQTLDVVREQPERLKVVALAAHSNVAMLEAQVREFTPDVACLTSQPQWALTDTTTRCWGGTEALVEVATYPSADIVVAATSGSAGFRPLLAALRAGKAVALANKEALVMAGELVRRAADRAGIQLRPVDSEHSALWQCLQGERGDSVSKLILTATGGPFREWTPEQLKAATPAQALRHPVWSMGSKITIDSATLMNKGLEVIEAHWLFGIPYDRIDVVIHPQGVVHSLVQFCDGALKAQLGAPDMRTPIRYALSWPDRWPSPQTPFDMRQVGSLGFCPPDLGRFPCLGLAQWAGREGGTYPTALCAADDVAVAAFLANRITWPRLIDVVRSVLDRHSSIRHPVLEDILEADRESRRVAGELVERMSLEKVH